MYIIRFHFKTPFHLGSARADYDISEKMMHSDTLYAAIFHSWNTLGMQEFIPISEDENIGFALSSMFPFYGRNESNKIVYFLPKPMIDMHEDIPFEKHKTMKKVAFIEMELYKKLFHESEKVENLAEYIYGEFLSEKKVPSDFMFSEVYPRVRIPRYGEEGQATPYYIDRIHFKDDSGYYCLAQFDSEDKKNAVDAAIRYLQDEGLGTDRHVGNGLFNYEIEEFKPDFPEFGTYCTNLSLFCPESRDLISEMIKNDARYELKRRGGWITTQPYMTYRKKSIQMFKEGSVFSVPDKIEANSGYFVTGKNENLCPEIPSELQQIEHPVWRPGRSIFIPFYF